MTVVAVVAPVPALRAGLAAMLRAAGTEVFDACGGLDELRLPLAAGGRTVLVCAGLALEQVGGLAAAQHDLALVWLSDHAPDAVQLSAMGWAGWAQLPAATSAAGLHAAVQAVAQGLVVLDGGLAGDVLQPPPIPPPDVTLTAREQEVLELISRGLPNKAIAARLQISDSTVKFHLQSAFAKLGAASRAEAVSTAARLGLMTL
jgi:DNA-binding NarL/FixJ family response regulator